MPGLVTEAEALDELFAGLDEAAAGWREADALQQESGPKRPEPQRTRMLELAA